MAYADLSNTNQREGEKKYTNPEENSGNKETEKGNRPTPRKRKSIMQIG